MGAAAISGFPPEVIARASQRCADLFNEGMIMRTLIETPFDRSKDFETRYAPEEIPDIPSDLEADASDDESKGDPVIDRSKIRKGNALASQQNYWSCVLKGCRRQDKGFPSQHDLKRHLRSAHKLTEDEIREELDGDSENSEVEGGVQYVLLHILLQCNVARKFHSFQILYNGVSTNVDIPSVDGFLKPIIYPKRSLGKRNHTKKRPRGEEEEESESAEELSSGPEGEGEDNERSSSS